MDGAVLAARLVLAAVFIAAGVGKLLDLPGSRRALRDFGVGEPLARYGGTALPILELATAAALLVQPVARWGGLAALLLLAAFSVGIVNALAHGQDPRLQLLRSISLGAGGSWPACSQGVLAALAGFVAVAGPGSSVRRGGRWARAIGRRGGCSAA